LVDFLIGSFLMKRKDDDVEFIAIKRVKAPTNQPWTDKYSPKSTGDISLTKNKMNEYTGIFEDAIKNGKTLLVSGPPGTGKSTIISRIFIH
jgi:type IV secretory pathway ATPase VirB11/archaellum biosynthesis ATPase